MSQVLTLKLKGLYTAYNELSSVPEGALVEAKNIDIINDNIAQPRKGFDPLSYGFSTSTDRADKLFYFKDKIFAHHGTVWAAGTLSMLNTSSWDSRGSITAPSGHKVRAAFDNQNMYLTSNAGVKKLENTTDNLKDAGAPKALDIKLTLVGSGTLLAANDVVAYRIVWGYYDSNDNLIIGSPSGRVQIEATAAEDVQIDAAIPSEVTTDWIYQIYRTSIYASSVDPNDEMQLVIEGSPDGTDITNGYIQETDNVPDELRGATLYTSPSQEGIANANERPPLAKDIALFRDSLFFANTVSKHRYNLTIIAVGASSGVQSGDTLSITLTGTVTYTAAVAQNNASGEFKVETGGTAAENIRDTALNLVEAINRYSSSEVTAHYLSGANDLPGKILIEEAGIGSGGFSIVASRETSWSPANIPSSGTDETSNNDEAVNGLYWSKPSQPESVPLVNYVPVGSKSFEIKRIVPLQDALIIFKEDGIYRLTGYYGGFVVELIDSSSLLIGNETPAVLNNQIYCMTDQGIVTVSDSVQIVSRPIEDVLRGFLDTNRSNFETYSFGVSYETDRKYLFFTVTNTSDTYATQAYVWNVFTQTWTRYEVAATAGRVIADNLHLGNPADEFVLKEKNTGTYSDYADYAFSVNITAIDDLVLTLNSNVDLLEAGDIIEQSGEFATIQSVDNIAGTITVDTDPGFTVAAADFYYAIDTQLKWAPISAGNPATHKHFHTSHLLVKESFNGTGYITISSDLYPSDTESPIAGGGVGGWGRDWGNNYGGLVGLRRDYRVWIPRQVARCAQLNLGFKHKVGYSPWEVQGVSVHYTQGTEKTRR